MKSKTACFRGLVAFYVQTLAQETKRVAYFTAAEPMLAAEL